MVRALERYNQMRVLFNRIDGVVVFLALVLLIMFVSVAITSLTSIIAPALMVAFAATLVGALLGFVFAVPRRVHRPAKESENGDSQSKSDEKSSVIQSYSQYDSNTSLEEICDWLTKIIVGVGLVEAQAIGNALDRAGSIVGVGAFGRPQGSFAAVTLGNATIISFAAIGFLMAFLWFRQKLIIAWSNSHLQSQAVPSVEMDRAPIERVQSGNIQHLQSKLPEEFPFSLVELNGGVDKDVSDEIKQKYAQVRENIKFEEDWVRGLFGGRPVVASPRRSLTAKVVPVQGTQYFQVSIEINSAPAATGQVALFLHNTFKRPINIIRFDRDGRACLKIYAWGAFTVGAILQDGGTELELDLAMLPDAPEDFVSR